MPHATRFACGIARSMTGDGARRRALCDERRECARIRPFDYTLAAIGVDHAKSSEWAPRERLRSCAGGEVTFTFMPAMPIDARTSLVQPEVKGISFYNLSESVQRLRGDEALARLRAQAPRHVLEMIEARSFMAVGWYPLDWYRDLVKAALHATNEGNAFAKELGRESTLTDFRGIYRLLKFVLAPQALLARAPAVYDRYRRPGRLTVDEAREGFARVRFEGCVGFDESLWQVATGSCVAVLETCGARNVRTRTISGARDGHTDAVFEGRWD
jgi:hypothetical protein